MYLFWMVLFRQKYFKRDGFDLATVNFLFPNGDIALSTSYGVSFS